MGITIILLIYNIIYYITEATILRIKKYIYIHTHIHIYIYNEFRIVAGINQLIFAI